MFIKSNNQCLFIITSQPDHFHQHLVWLISSSENLLIWFASFSREFVFSLGGIEVVGILLLYDIAATARMVAWNPISMSALAIVTVAVLSFHAAIN